jgi:sec-independent protein translocase protein TatA
MGKLGLTEILVILAVVLLLFGGKKIPELMKGLGSGIKEFKNAAKDDNPPVSKSQHTSTDPIAPSDPSNPRTTVVEDRDNK